MWYKKVNFINVKSKEELFANLKQPNSMIIAGGTDVFVRLKNQKQEIDNFVNILEIPELKQIELQNNNLVIGSCVTFSELIEQIEKIFPPLFKAAEMLAAPQLRNTATIGGNIVNASPAGDSLPVLYAFDAKLKLESEESSRIIKIKDFITGPGRTALKPGELLTQIIINIPNYEYSYKKFGTRKSLALSKVSFCGVRFMETGQIIMAFGASGPIIIIVEANEAQKFDKVLEKVSETVVPISDQRSEADYRKHLCIEVSRDFLSNIK